MPIYRGKKRKQVVTETRIGLSQETNFRWRGDTLTGRRKRIFVRRPKQRGQESTSIQTIEKELKTPLRAIVEEKSSKLKRPITVVDWGCGTGEAINALGKLNKVNAIGFSMDSYKDWNKHLNAQFFHETDETLLRLLKPKSVDVMYSRTGLRHQLAATDIAYRKFPSIEKRVNYLVRLFDKLAVDGLLIFDFPTVLNLNIPIPTQAMSLFKQKIIDALRDRAQIVYTPNPEINPKEEVITIKRLK